MEKIINKIVKELKKDPQLLGIILFGSVASGDVHPNSDIDLIAIYQYDVDRVRCKLIDGKLVQILERSFDGFKNRLFKKTRKIPYSFTAKVLYDKSDNIKELIDKAKEEAKRSGPPQLSDEDILNRQISLSQDIYTIEGLIQNNQFEGATLLMNDLLQKAIDLYYNHHRLYKVNLKRIIDDLKTHDKELANACSLILLSNDIKAKIANLWVVRNHALALVGGEKMTYEINF